MSYKLIPNAPDGHPSSGNGTLALAGSCSDRLSIANLLRRKRLADRLQKRPSARFLTPTDIDTSTLHSIIGHALAIKTGATSPHGLLHQKRVALLFQKTSTRTRCSFEVGVWDMGGLPSVIDWAASNFVLTDLADEIQVLGRYYDMIVARVRSHADLEIMAEHAGVPVINGLSDHHHPCQALADYMTMTEYFGDLQGLPVTYVGDGNNVCQSLMALAPVFGVKLTVATPENFTPLLSDAHLEYVKWTDDPAMAVKGAAVVYTDCWVSIGMEGERSQRLKSFEGFQVNSALLHGADKGCLVMHCLPAHVGEEISSDVLRGDQSIVLDQAENRKFAQMALMRQLLA